MHRYTITQEQQVYRDKLLNKRKGISTEKTIPAQPVTTVKKKRGPHKKKTKQPFIIEKPTTLQYMKNCMYWINEYAEGRVDKQRLAKSIAYLKMHIKTFEHEHL